MAQLVLVAARQHPARIGIDDDGGEHRRAVCTQRTAAGAAHGAVMANGVAADMKARADAMMTAVIAAPRAGLGVGGAHAQKDRGQPDREAEDAQ